MLRFGGLSFYLLTEYFSCVSLTFLHQDIFPSIFFSSSVFAFRFHWYIFPQIFFFVSIPISFLWLDWTSESATIPPIAMQAGHIY